MKNWFKYITILFAGAALLATSCEDTDMVVDQVTAGTTRGAILRTVDLGQSEVLFDSDNSVLIDGGFSTILEVQDAEGGELLSEIEVYAGFRDNTSDGVDDRDEILLGTIPASEGVPGEFGLPRFTYSIGYEELQNALNLPDDAFFGGDQFTIRFELVLTDGRRFSFDDNTGTITGSFFSSPFLYTINVVCAVEEGLYTGTYTLTQDTPGVFPTTFQEGNVEVTATSSTGRSIALIGYPQFGGFPLDFAFDLICNEVVVQELDTGLTCTTGEPGLVYQAADDLTVEYNGQDDSTLTITFTEVGGSCGGSVDVTFTLTKI
ncbi:hypothetical protein [Flagellimonas sp.]|uniref:hypothetical protein n=1 Tax=Flagellimonas sp. TaxID=2058762 RepID=UPI003C7BBC03